MAFAHTRAANPGALGLTIGLNAAAVLALALWNPNIIKFIDHGITTIKIDPIADPPPPEKIVETKSQPKRVIDQPKRTVETGGFIDDWRPKIIDPGTTVIGGGGTSTGGSIIADPPKPPEIREIVRRPPMLATAAGELQPPYPPALQRQEVEGSVTVRVRVGTDGRPRDIELIRADDPQFFAAAKNWGMRHWRFKPASEDGGAVEGWYTLTVKFTLA